jgi:lysozyme
MKISESGVDIVKEFEGYRDRLPDGGCKAYRCIVGRDKKGRPIHDGKWTIGWGCTEGITASTVWTRKQAEEGLRRELEKGERIVERNVTVDLNQNQFDALVSFAYNVGEGDKQRGISGFATSTLLKHINAGRWDAAAGQFKLWTGSNGVKNVPGLVRRRQMEKALFLKPVEVDVAVADEALAMPQTVDAPSAAAEQLSAHGVMQEASSLYSAHGHLINKGGWSVPPFLVAVWNWASDPLHALLLASGGVFAAFVAVELLRLRARNKLLGEA